jgi:hypothetical protein
MQVDQEMVFEILLAANYFGPQGKGTTGFDEANDEAQRNMDS